jgi:Fe-S cluster assembly protein SufD
VRPFTADAAVALPGPPWLRALRGAAAERALATPSPTEAEEIWRYSRIGELDLDRYVLAQPGLAPGAPDAIAAAVAATRAAIPSRAAFVMLIDGQVVHHELDEALAARGLRVSEPGDEALGRRGDDRRHRPLRRGSTPRSPWRRS